MNHFITLSEKSVNRFNAALEWLGFEKCITDNELAEEITGLLNKYFEESGCPSDSNGNPINNVIKTIEFVYQKNNESVSWRTLHVIEENDKYFLGYENGSLKRFNKCNIVGDKVIPA